LIPLGAFAIVWSMEPSIFTKIINGELPCHKIYEDDKTIAFLDIYPIQPGHILVVPKQQIDHLDDLDDDTYAHLFRVVKMLAKRVKLVLGVQRACLTVQGFDVPHAHIQIIPCNQAADFYRIPDRSGKPNDQALGEMARRLATKEVVL